MNLRKQNRRRSDAAIAYAIIRTTILAVIAAVIVSSAATVIAYKYGVTEGKAESRIELAAAAERNLELRRRLEE